MEQVKVGDKIHIVYMSDKPEYSGKEGVVEHIDDMGNIHGSWGGCALLPNVDYFYIIKENE